MRYALLALLWLLFPTSLALGAILVFAAKKSSHPLTAMQRGYLAMAFLPMFVTLVVPAMMFLIFSWDIHKNGVFQKIGEGLVLTWFLGGILLVIQSELRHQRKHSMLLGTAALVAASPTLAHLLILAFWRMV